MLDCTTERYDLLYARWLERPGDLLDLAGYEPGMNLLDLCGGTGAVTREALRRGAPPESLTLLDLNPRLDVPGVRCLRGDAEHLHRALDGAWGAFDVIVCRQAIAYIDLTSYDVWEPIWSMLTPGGRFAFNSFARPRWALRPYRHDGAGFVEASGWVPWPGGGRVLHLQWRIGAGLDVSSFQWHREADLRRALDRFDVEVHRSGRGLRWVCTRP